jgi:tetratricopeptide (TPR) repeat protein
MAGLRAISLNPNNEFGYFACVASCTLINRRNDAIACFENELNLTPDHPTLWISYGWRGGAHPRAGRGSEAKKAYGKALQLTPDNAASKQSPQRR